jgi:flagellar basal-body rod protein FlgF
MPEAVMLYGIGISGTGAHIEQTRMDVLANNLANTDTPGFKQQVLSLMERPAAALDVHGLADAWKLGHRHELLDRQGGGVQVRDVLTETTQGDLRETGNHLDLALQGPGYFVMEHFDRGEVFTRAGNFALAPDGSIVNRDGNAYLLDHEGKRLNFNQLAATFGASGSRLGIAPDGSISVIGANGGSEDTGRRVMLAVLESSDEQRLEHLGGTLLAPRAGEQVNPAAVHQTQVRQGMLERSTADSVALMARMVDVSRAYEANLRMLRIQDQTLATLIQRVAEVPA